MIYEKYEQYDMDQNKYCCIYAYYEKNYLYKDNFMYFLNNGILDNVDYYIVINGDYTVDIPSKNNIKVYKRENIGYDFGAYSYIVKKLQKKYNYYFFLNTSVKGPYLKDKSKAWTDIFIELFHSSNDIKLVGTSINIFTQNYYHNYDLRELYNKERPFPHIQSMFFCMDYEYFNHLMNIHFFNEEEMNHAKSLSYIIANKEIGLSQIALNKNWNINSILSKYKNFDYRHIEKDMNSTSHNGDPYYDNAYFGDTIDKYDVIFFKNNR
jgi:hypothetical protein